MITVVADHVAAIGTAAASTAVGIAELPGVWSCPAIPLDLVWVSTDLFSLEFSIHFASAADFTDSDFRFPSRSTINILNGKRVEMPSLPGPPGNAPA